MSRGIVNLMRVVVLFLFFLGALSCQVKAEELVWKENIRPLAISTSIQYYDDYFVYTEGTNSENVFLGSISSIIGQESEGWGYLFFLHSLREF